MKKLLILALSLGLALAALGPAAAGDPGVTATSVKLGAFTALSGPVAFVGRPIYHGCDAYFKWINDQGGVHGRKIQFVVEDDGYQPAKAVAASKKLVEQDKIFAMVMPTGTPSCVAAQPYLLEKGVPVVWPVSAASRFSGKYKQRTWFAIQPRSQDEAALYVRYAVDTLKKKRILAFCQNDDFGKDGLEGIKDEVARLKKLGKKVDLVDTVYYNIQDTDYKSLVMKMKTAKPDVIIAYSILRATASMLKAAKALGLKSAIIINYANASNILFALAGKGAVEGVYSAGYVDIHIPASDPKMKAYYAAQKKFYPKDNPNNAYYMAGWNMGMVMVEGLRQAGKDLTRESLIKGMEKIKNWNGSWMRKVTYGPDRRQGVKTIYMVRGKNGQWDKISDWISLD